MYRRLQRKIGNIVMYKKKLMGGFGNFLFFILLVDGGEKTIGWGKIVTPNNNRWNKTKKPINHKTFPLDVIVQGRQAHEVLQPIPHVR